MYYLTIGYPLGAEIIDNRQIYQISLNSKTIRLLPIEYRIWSRFLLGAQDEEVERTLSEQDQYGFAPTMNKLLQAGMLHPLSGDFSEMKDLIFLRQGIGAGLDFETNTYNIVFCNIIQLNFLEYSIWKEANGVIAFEELERRLILKYKYSVENIRNTVVGLCRRGILISINRIEG